MQVARRSYVTASLTAAAIGGGILIIVLASVSRGTFPPWSNPGPRGAVAVRLADGKVFIGLKACGQSPRVTAIEVDSARDVRQILWRIESAPGSDAETYVLGDTPAGFTQVVALQAPLSPGERYYVDASQPEDRPLGLPGVVFDPDELREDRWIVSRGKILTDAEFDRFDPC